MNKYILGLFIGLLLITTACNTESEQQVEGYERYSTHLFDYFDTVVQVIGYTTSEEEFYNYTDKIEERFTRYHKLFDKYNEYEGMNNVKTINDNAGHEAVEVDQEIIDIINFSKKWYEKTNGKMNIAGGSLITIWKEIMDEVKKDPENTELPSMEELEKARESTDIDQIIVNEDEKTVFLADENMSLDFGAITKGFVAEIVGEDMKEKGFTSGAIISGGNWEVLGEPKDPERDYWKVGIQDPEHPHQADESAVLKRIKLQNQSIDTSGDYQRFVMVDDLRVHHIIDMDTMMPANHHRGVTVIADSAVVTEYLTTELFLLTYEKGRDLVNSFDGVEALWVIDHDKIKMTDGMEERLQ
ncbi:FAD:protein FMN transferase [Texcoconibacillus texcoconensis]|uniref:FAD:protein FMN transferase n=1 Tax=Texcoconibacillus texcoconensis TaxID=1095777 RepID=A0A840QS36_9BACI|nr:FAD:protein FMN transferase [Texcoconibacillus texcoconensis]MBB5174312.1 thiamine biosynthesis lipoprotein [Texcoconibacillus texcoconensis]